MKIFHVIPSMQTGGPQVFLADLLPALKERGADVSLLVYNESHSRHESILMKEGVKVLSMGSRHKYGMRVIPLLHAELAKADLVHVHLSPAIYQCAVTSLDLRTPMVCTVYNRIVTKKWLNGFRKWALGRYKAVVVPSESVAADLGEWLGDDLRVKERMRLLPCGINLERLRATRRAPGFGTAHRVITMIANFHEQKDQRTLIRAISLITDPRLVVVFIGDGPTLKAHEEYARMLGVADRVRFLGARDDTPALIAGTTIGVQASHRERFAMPALEFMGFGKPVLGSDIPGVRDIIGDERLLFPPGDETRLAGLINHLLNDPVYYREISEECLVRSEQFSIYDAADSYIKLYEEVLAANN